MLQKTTKRLFTSLARFHPSREPFTALESLVVVSAFLYIWIGLNWGVMYFAFGEFLPGLIPFTYGVFTTYLLAHFLRKRNVDIYMLFQLPLTLMLPFLLQISTGGFVSASAVVMFSFTSPLIALVVSGPKVALRWFLAFLSILVISALIDPLVLRENLIPATFKTFLFILNIFGVVGVSFIILYYFVLQRDAAYALLHTEQEKSEGLLLNILPKEIADTLMRDGQTAATKFDTASVLFADLVGFTPMTARLSPEEMVALLNQVFSQFDTFVEQYGVEKIRTIGDNYMAASGVPTPRPDHASVLADMALDMKSYLDDLDSIKGQKVDFRIGINCGSMIGGIIGTRKFQYDVWGDAVNIASRMESQGVAGRIQVTRDFYTLLSDDYEFEKRGAVEVKGSGMIDTWFLVGKKANGES